MAEQIAYMIIAYAIGRVAMALLEPDPETPLIDEKPTTRSTRGSFIPTLIGTRRIGPFIVWCGERRTITETTSTGGKGGGGSSTKQTIYFESCIHAICVGPAYALRRIWVNGAIAKLGEKGVGITSDDTPSGSTITIAWLQGEDTVVSKFQIFWGEDDGPINSFAQSPLRLGLKSKWPFICHLNWIDMRLGGFAVWPTIEYEMEVRPYGTSNVGLTTSSWMYGPGSTGNKRLILTARNSTNVGGSASDFPMISVSGAMRSDGNFVEQEYQNGRRDSIPTNGLANLQGQPATTKGIYGTSYLRTTSLPTNKHEYITRDYDTVPGDLWASEKQLGNVSKDLTTWDMGGFPSSVTYVGNLILGNGKGGGGGNITADHGSIYRLDGSTVMAGSMSVWKDQGSFNKVSPNSSAPGAAQYIQFFVSNILPWGDTTTTDGSHSCWIGFKNKTTGASHTVKIYYDSTQTLIADLTDSNGAWCVEIKYLDTKGTPPFNGTGKSAWYNIKVAYKTETGDTVSSNPELRTWYVSCQNTTSYNETLDLCTFDTYGSSVKSIDAIIKGTIITGTTSVELASPLQGAYEDVGTAEGIGDYNPSTVEGAMFYKDAVDGANPGHVLYQLLFAPFPHGAGLSTDNWDIPSLETIAALTASEGARTHVLAPNGKMAKGIIISVLHDSHCYIAWDLEKGKYIFGSIRDTVTDLLPEIPIDAVLSPAPEHDTVHEVGIPNQLVFSYPSRKLAYRNSTRVAYEDTVASEFNNRIIKKSSITTATDSFYVDAIAERKQLEELIPVNKYKIVANRDSKYLHPGQAFTVFDFPAKGEEETLRVIETQYSPGDKKVTIDAVTDVYSLIDTQASTSLSPPDPGFDEPGFEEITILQDVATSIWELPPKLTFGTFSYMPLRIRANQKTGQTPAYSSKDDISYALTATDIPYCTGGTLEVATDSTSDDIDTLVITGLGEDLKTFPKTLDDNNWIAGQQLCVIDTEVFFLQSVTGLGNNRYSLNGLKRAKHTSTAAVHAIDSVAFIFPIGSIIRIKDPLAEVGQAIYVKLVPLGLTLADITTAKITKTLTGTGQIDYQASPTDASIRDALTALGFMKES